MSDTVQLISAIKDKTNEQVSELLGKMDIGRVNQEMNDTTALHTACVEFNDKALDLLLSQRGIHVNVKDIYLCTPLHWATTKNNIYAVSRLVTNPQVDVNVKATYGYTPLHRACNWNHEQIVKLLLASPQIDVNSRTDDGSTPLIMACVWNHFQIVKVLLVNPGIDVNAKTVHGLTPLYIACEWKNFQIVKELLVSPGIQVNVADKYGLTPLMVCARYCDEEILKIMLENSSVDLDIKDRDGNGLEELVGREEGGKEAKERCLKMINNEKMRRRNGRMEQQPNQDGTIGRRIEKVDRFNKEIRDEEETSARHNIQNEDIDEVVNFIEGKSLGAVPKQENKETRFKNKKKEKNPDEKCKVSGYKGNNRKKPDTKSKDIKTTNNSLIEEITTSKELTDETENQLKEGKLKNSQLNFKVTSVIQESDLSNEPLKEMPRRDPKEIREEVRDQYIKDIVEVNEKIENVEQEFIKNAEKKAKELEVLKTKQNEEKIKLDEESGREKGKVQGEMDKLKEEMSRIKKRMTETEAKWDGKKQEMSARHTEENEAVEEKYTDQESQKALSELKTASAQLTEDMNKLDIDPNVVKQVDGAREVLECPICMEIMSPPMKIWMCSGSHCVCEKCKSLLPGNLCPTCRTNKVDIRARTVEDLARALFKQ